ncbi:DUF418 domain-containing protein [Shouchella patagoniensis]|uniref:DUF418 domain-containing protein n=1 Tax=Shouchella patagoniensis TaxID=228576 RepID=UPI0009955FC8|nr:DUF418 domain-containing protein [Shouchella patagoniensis]
MDKRLEVIDALRGFALLGIIIVNVRFFNEAFAVISLGGLPAEGRVNTTIEVLISIFFEGKFILLFSFLFGLGTWFIYIGASREGASFASRYFKRIAFLWIIGIFHGTFIWYGDILSIYAMVGLILLCLVKRSSSVIFTFAIISTLLIPVILLVFDGSGYSNELTIETDTLISYQEDSAAAYRDGTFSEQQLQRLNDYIGSLLTMVLFVPQILGMFLLGLYVGKRQQGIFTNKKTMKKLAVFGMGLGLPIQVINVIYDHQLLQSVAHFIAAPILMFGYVGCFCLLYRVFPIRGLVAVGRMGFTNYLMQSLLLATLFYGFSLFGEMVTWQTFVISLTVFIVQFLYSSVYMSRFRTGPLESVWRSVYKR